MMETLSVVVLTGGREGHKELLADVPYRSKTLLPVGGKPMLCSVVDAVQASGYPVSLYISTSDPDVLALPLSMPYTVLPTEGSAVQSILRSLERVSENEWVLFISGDHPLLTPEMIRYFVNDVLQRKLTMGVAITDRALVMAHYPEAKRTFMPVKNGAYSGGNMYLIHKPRFQANAPLLEAVDRNRKKHWKTLFWLGWPTVLLTLLRLIDIHQLGVRFSKIMGCQTGPVIMPWAESCMDVDKVVDKLLAEKIMVKRQQLSSPKTLDKSCAKSITEEPITS